MTRHFVYIGGRQVHYRRWGEGPALLALHGSPQSSRAIAGLAQSLASAGFCVIAPDTPGNGLSSALSQPSPEASDYAVALARFADAIGLQRVSLYGFHTGAGTACAFAALYPDRVRGVVFEGLPAWTEQERAACLSGYLPPFRPLWDGSHMAWLWARMEEQSLFFPWHTPTPGARLDYDLGAPEHLHANAMDMLDAGDAYRAAYRAAFTFRPEDWLERITAPSLFASTRADVLHSHLEDPRFANQRTESFDSAASLHHAAGVFLGANPGDQAPPAPESGGDSQGLRRDFSAGLSWRGRLSGPGRPLVLLHETGEDLHRFDPALGALGLNRPVVAIDLPGHGASSPLAQTIDPVDQLAGALAALGLKDAAVLGVRYGGQLAAALALRGAAAQAATLGASVYDAAETQALRTRAAPSLAPEWDGAHLVRAFRIARAARLHFPWCVRDRAHALPVPRSLDPEDVHAGALRLLRAAAALAPAYDAETRFDLAATAARLGARLKVYALDGDPLSAPSRLAALGASEPLPASVAAWAPALAAYAS
jgi:pimeloyl-ACP methyl ester carboxylesterase